MVLDLKDEVGVSRLILKNQRFEPYACELVDRHIKPHMSAVDIGANIGFWSLFLTKRTDKPVYLFEPEPANFALLKQNLEMNQIPNAQLFNKGLGSEAKRLTLHKSKKNFGDHRLYASESGRETVQVDVVRLDDEIGVLKDLGFIKIDVQGFELQSLLGARKNLEANRDLTILSEFWPKGMRLAGSNPNDYLDYLTSLGFSFKVLDEKSSSLLTMNREQLFQHCENLKSDVDLWWSR